MKNILYIVLVSLILAGCSERVVDTLQNRNGVGYAINEENPYTGRLIEYWGNGEKKREVNYKDGKQDRTSNPLA